MDDSHSYTAQLVRAPREETSQRVSQQASLADAERVLDGRRSR